MSLYATPPITPIYSLPLRHCIAIAFFSYILYIRIHTAAGSTSGFVLWLRVCSARGKKTQPNNNNVNNQKEHTVEQMLAKKRNIRKIKIKINIRKSAPSNTNRTIQRNANIAKWTSRVFAPDISSILQISIVRHNVKDARGLPGETLTNRRERGIFSYTDWWLSIECVNSLKYSKIYGLRQ